MSTADELNKFRRETEEFWSKVGQKRKVVATKHKAAVTRKRPGARAGIHQKTNKRRRSSSR